MKFRILAATVALAVIGASAVIAAEEPQVARQGMMKKVGGAMGALAGIAKGEKPYDAEIVKASLTTMSEVAKAFPEQFPVGSETGAESEASPKIWELQGQGCQVRRGYRRGACKRAGGPGGRGCSTRRHRPELWRLS